MSATSACASGSRGMSAATMRASRSASAATSGRTQGSPDARQVPLGEDEVEHAEHRPEPGRVLLRSGTSNGTFAAARVFFARTMRCWIVATGTRNARAISSE